MRWFVFSVVCLLGQPAAADDKALLDFMGGQGCTFGQESRAAAVEAGFNADQIDGVVTAMLADGLANQEGRYVVLGEAVCTIRLPDITSIYTVNAPEIAAITSTADPDAADGQRGCFLIEPRALFAKLHGGPGRDEIDEYLDFIAASIIAGDLRFYGPSVLATPPGFQVVTGECADVPNIASIRRSHSFVGSGFGQYIRLLGAENTCHGAIFGVSAQEFPARVQGIDLDFPLEGQREINAWLFFEYDLIALAAGWHEGMTGTDKGRPRPPLCHYPSQA
jgi:hypothetical protein